MKVFACAPCNWGNDFDDARFVAANSREEALTFLASQETGKYGTHWLKDRTICVYSLDGVDYPTDKPCNIELTLHTEDGK